MTCCFTTLSTGFAAHRRCPPEDPEPETCATETYATETCATESCSRSPRLAEARKLMLQKLTLQKPMLQCLKDFRQNPKGNLPLGFGLKIFLGQMLKAICL